MFDFLFFVPEALVSVQKRISLYAYLLRFWIGRKGRHFKTRTGYRRAKTLCMSTLFILNSSNSRYNTKTCSSGKLSKAHYLELITTNELLCSFVAIILVNAPLELIIRDDIHDLSEYSLSFGHGQLNYD